MKRARENDSIESDRRGYTDSVVGERPFEKVDVHAAKSHPSHPVVFLDVSINEKHAGRLYIELFSTNVPKTAENFRQLCTGEHLHRGLPLGYKDVPFHRIVKNFAVIGGDVLKKDGSGSTSIYGTFFDDENFELTHDRVGIVSMMSAIPDRNGCQFMILAKPAPELDGKNVVTGQVLFVSDARSSAAEATVPTTTDATDSSRMSPSKRLLNLLLSAGTGTGIPQRPCAITQCGEM